MSYFLLYRSKRTGYSLIVSSDNGLIPSVGFFIRDLVSVFCDSNRIEAIYSDHQCPHLSQTSEMLRDALSEEPSIKVVSS